MKNKTYRTVSVEDRLPKIDGVYIVRTKPGMIKTSCFKNGGFVGTKIGGDEGKITSYIEYWLEEIELPSEDEMKNLYSLNRDFYDSSFAAGMHKGANFIINHIKGGG